MAQSSSAFTTAAAAGIPLHLLAEPSTQVSVNEVANKVNAISRAARAGTKTHPSILIASRVSKYLVWIKLKLPNLTFCD